MRALGLAILSTALTKRIPRHRLIFVLPLMVLAQALVVENAGASPKDEYPIILIHGLNSNAEVWDNWYGRASEQFDWTECPTLLRYCLDLDGNPRSNNLDIVDIGSSPINADIGRVPIQGLGEYDVYRIDFDTSPCYPIELNSVIGEFVHTLPFNAILHEADGETFRIRIDTSLLEGVRLGLWAQYKDYQANKFWCVVEEKILPSLDNPDPPYNLVLRKENPEDPNPHSVFGLGGLDVFDTSSQEAIMKQARALGDAIKRVLAATNETKVILVGHSMGGLAARTYLQMGASSLLAQDERFWVDPYDLESGHGVAHLLTIGTPHLGSNAAEMVLASIAGFDPKGNAARDLAYDYYGRSGEGDNTTVNTAVFLFGGAESTLDSLVGIGQFRSSDISCNAEIDFPGLNNTEDPYMPNPGYALPQNISYFYISGNAYDTPYVGDGVVRFSRSFMSNGEIRRFFAKHSTNLPSPSLCSLPEAFAAIVEGLDSGDDVDQAVDLKFSNTGHLTYQGDYSGLNPDYDLFRFEVPFTKEFTAQVAGPPLGYKLSIYNADLEIIGSDEFFPAGGQGTITRNLVGNGSYDSPTQYYLMVESISPPDGVSWEDGCTLDDGAWTAPYIVTTPITVSGHVLASGGEGLAGVALTGFPTGVTSGPGGLFQAQIPYGWTGTVIPILEGFAFSPASATLPPVQEDVTGLIFEANPTLLTVAAETQEEIYTPEETVVILGRAYYGDDSQVMSGSVQVTAAGESYSRSFSDGAFTVPVGRHDESFTAIVTVYDASSPASGQAQVPVYINAPSSLAIVVPQPGDRWPIGYRQDVCWDFTGASAWVDISLSRDGGASWEPFGNAPGGEECSEVMVTAPASSHVFVRVAETNDPSVFATIGPIEIYEVPDNLMVGLSLSGAVSSDNEDQNMDYSPDGRYLAYRVSPYNQITIRDTRTYQVVATPFPSGLGFMAMGFSPNSQYLASVGNGLLYIWDLQTGSWRLRDASTNSREGESLVWIDNTRVAIIGDTYGGEDGAAIYDIDGNLQTTLTGANLMSLASDGIYVYGGDSDGYLYRWALTGGNPQLKISKCMNDVFALEVSPTSNRMLAVGRGLSECGRPNITLVGLPALGTIDQGWVFNDTEYIMDASYDPTNPSRIAIVEHEGGVAVINEQLQVVMQAQAAGAAAWCTDISWSPNGVVAVNAQGGIKLYPVTDITEPEIALDEPIIDVISGCALDATGVMTLAYRFDGEDWQAATLTPDGCFSIPVPDLASGVHAVYLDAIDMAENHSYASAEFFVECQEPPAPVPTAPIDGGMLSENRVLLEWEPVDGATAYEFLCHPVGEGGEIDTTQSPAAIVTDLVHGVVYIWQVRAVNACGNPGAWSTEWEFAVEGTPIALYADSPPFALNTNSIGYGDSEVFFISSVTNEGLPPAMTTLGAPSPNPFNPKVSVPFAVSRREIVDINVYDVRGGYVKRLVRREFEPGLYRIVWTGRDDSGRQLAAGVYFVQLTSPTTNTATKVTLIK